MQCAYVYKKGALKNQQCPIKPYNGFKFCHKHKKYNKVEETNDIHKDQELEATRLTDEQIKNEENNTVEILTLPKAKQETKKDIEFETVPESYDSDKEILDKDEYNNLLQ